MYQDGQIQITTFYKFYPLSQDQVDSIKYSLDELGKTYDLKGLVILGTEGVNATISYLKSEAQLIREEVLKALNIGDLKFKDSFADKHPFDELKAKQRPEIVTLGRTDLVPLSENHRHISPEEWNRVLKEEEDVLVIDTRNDYEYEVGHFKGAINPDTEEFTEFPEFLKKSKIPTDKKVLIYCTGGIRCEKAILDMEEQGYKNVYQLDGGILNYLEKFPNSQWDGECFVFDYRVAVDQNLKPSETYRLCPHCGQPGKTKIKCTDCSTEAIVCQTCLDLAADKHSCSKHCAYRIRFKAERAEQKLKA